MGLRTIVLKIHEPGRGKQEILDTAIQNYNKAFRFLLERAFGELQEIRETYRGSKDSYKSAALSKWVGDKLSEELNKFDVQPFKDSLKMELGMTLAGYFNLKAIRPATNFPLMDSKAGSENKRLRPVFFCRYDTKRSYCLLYDNEKNRYYAKLYLMNSANSRTVTANNSGRKLVYVHMNDMYFESKRKKETFILVPLSFGKYQEGFLQAALKKPEILRTAKLENKNGEYFLSISIFIEDAEKVKTNTFMGVARGLKNELNFSIVDSRGKLLTTGEISGRNGEAAEAGLALEKRLHIAANNISAIALENKSQVVLQNLFKKGDRINWTDEDGTDYQPSYKCGSYNELVKLLEYKLPERGLPPPVKVSSVDIFYKCHSCGLNSRRNRLTRDIFICTACGATMEVEALGSLNLAKKLISYNNSRIRIKLTKTQEGILFTNSLLELDYFIPYTENQPEKLKEKLTSIIEDIRNGIKFSQNNETRKKSIIKKFDSSVDFMSLIEFI